MQDARVHYADLKQQTHQGQPPHPSGRGVLQGGPEDSRLHPITRAGLILQDPTVCQPPHQTATTRFHTPPHRQTPARLGSTETVTTHQGSFIDDSTSEHHRCHPHGPAWKTQTAGGCAGRVLLRKEVIQPHLPVRLPCYDFVPIASPTFDGSLPQGVRPPASGVADFRDVTGGVYKARERIHRSVADLRLLATPTSRGRVADPDPN